MKFYKREKKNAENFIEINSLLEFPSNFLWSGIFRADVESREVRYVTQKCERSSHFRSPFFPHLREVDQRRAKSEFSEFFVRSDPSPVTPRVKHVEETRLFTSPNPSRRRRLHFRPIRSVRPRRRRLSVRRRPISRSSCFFRSSIRSTLQRRFR